MMKSTEELEGENRRHKEMYAEAKLKAGIAVEATEKLVKPSHRWVKSMSGMYR